MNFPSRIVCLTEETTEILYDLGAEDLIVGISGYTVRPSRARKEKPKVSAFITAKIDKILDLKPHLVLGFSDLQSEICSTLINKGVNILCFNQRSISEILNVIEFIGRIVNLQEKTERYLRDINSNLNNISMSAKNLKNNPKVFFEEWNDPIITGIKWVSELVEIAGGIDVFKHYSSKPNAKDRIIKNSDEVVEANPDIIFASWCGKKLNKDKIIERNNWHKINAVKNNNIYEIKSSLILQPGPAALTDGLNEIQKVISNWSMQQK